MLFLSTLTFLFIACVSGSNGNGHGRILNGQDSDVLPYQVKLNLCGGTIIKLDWVLTAQHCVVVDMDRGDLTKMPETVLAGISNIGGKETAQIRNVSVESIFLYNSKDDLALLKIDPPFEQSDDLWPIQLNDDYENIVGEEVLISGWGKTTNENAPEQLQKVFVTVKDQELDTSFFKAGHVLHLWSTDGEGACQGDSGGPAVYWYDSCPRCQVLVGVASYISGSCGPYASPEQNDGARDSYYVDVFHYLDWIDDITYKNTNN